MKQLATDWLRKKSKRLKLKLIFKRSIYLIMVEKFLVTSSLSTFVATESYNMLEECECEWQRSKQICVDSNKMVLNLSEMKIKPVQVMYGFLIYGFLHPRNCQYFMDLDYWKDKREQAILTLYHILLKKTINEN